MKKEIDTDFLEDMLPFWDKLSSNEEKILLDNAISAVYKKGTPVHNADFQCIGMLLVKSGSLRVYILSEDGREITLYRVNRGEVCILSASCVLKSITFDVYIEAVTDSEVIKLHSSAVSLLMEDNIHVEAYAYRTATERFSDVMWAMQQILFMSFDKRLAIFLLDESSSLHTDEIKMTHEEIAKFMGSAREVVTRMLKYFSLEGYVELSRGTVKLTNKKGLMALIQ